MIDKEQSPGRRLDDYDSLKKMIGRGLCFLGITTEGCFSGVGFIELILGLIGELDAVDELTEVLEVTPVQVSELVHRGFISLRISQAAWNAELAAGTPQ